MLIITRFHDVLFETDRFYGELWESLFRDDLSRDDWMEAYRETIRLHQNFDIRHFLQLLVQTTSLTAFELRGRMNHALNTLSLGEYVDNDWFAMRKTLSSSCSTTVFVGLIFGDVKFEKKLLERTGLKGIFDDIFYATLRPVEVIEDILKKYPRERIFYIDTLMHQLSDIQQQFPTITTIAIDRKNRDDQQECQSVHCVRNFQEAGAYIFDRSRVHLNQ